MSAYLFLPILFLKFWFYTAPFALVRYFSHVNRILMHYLSIPLLLRTFFQPLKNEYRPGLVGFSRGMGIVLKSFLLVVTTGILLLCIFFEWVVLMGFLFVPIGTVYLLTL